MGSSNLLNAEESAETIVVDDEYWLLLLLCFFSINSTQVDERSEEDDECSSDGLDEFIDAGCTFSSDDDDEVVSLFNSLIWLRFVSLTMTDETSF